MLQFILVLIVFIFNAVQPAIAVERPFDLTGTGNLQLLADTNGNPSSGLLIAKGTATHLGTWIQLGTLSFTPKPDTITVILANGDSTFTGADGDELQAQLDGELDTTTGIATGTFVFNGGTGRFNEATGSANFKVTQDLDSGAFEVTANGTIDY